MNHPANHLCDLCLKVNVFDVTFLLIMFLPLFVPVDPHLPQRTQESCDHVTFFRPSVWSKPDIPRLWRDYRRLGIFWPNFTPFYPLFCPSISPKWLFFDCYCCRCLRHIILLNYMTYASKILFLRRFICKFSHFHPFFPILPPFPSPCVPKRNLFWPTM